jgi:hypothetical protein
MARNILHVGHKAGKRSHGWRTSAPAAPVRTSVAEAQTRGRFRRKGYRVNAGLANATVRPSQIQLITVYAVQHGFDVPVMSDWSAANAEDFFTQMQTMVADGTYTYE